MIFTYLELASDVSKGELNEVKQLLESHKVNPRDLKRRLARSLVRMYHSQQAAEDAEREFDRIFVNKSLPDNIEVFTLSHANTPSTITDLLTEAKLTASRGEARRLIDQGGVSIDGERVPDFNTPLPDKKEFVVKVGKRRFLKVKR